MGYYCPQNRLEIMRVVKVTKKMLGISSERETEGEILVVVEHKIIEALLHINVRQDEDRLCYWNVFANVRFSNEAVIQFPSKLFDLHVRE